MNLRKELKKLCNTENIDGKCIRTENITIECAEKIALEYAHWTMNQKCGHNNHSHHQEVDLITLAANIIDTVTKNLTVVQLETNPDEILQFGIRIKPEQYMYINQHIRNEIKKYVAGIKNEQ